MERDRRRATWWLIGCLAVASVLAGMTINRVYNATQLESGAGANVISSELMSQAVQSLTAAALVALVGFVPAAVLGLRSPSARAA